MQLFAKEYEKKYKLNLNDDKNKYASHALWIYAMVQAIKEFPVINAIIDSKVKNIIYRDYIDMLVPISLKDGSQVNVVLRDCQNKSFTDILKDIHAYSQKALNNQLSLEDIQPGTVGISISNESLLSVNTVEENTTVKLGINKVESKPHCVDNNPKIIQPRDIMLISLTYDHRLIDGREGVLYLKRVKEIMENPVRIVFNL